MLSDEEKEKIQHLSSEGRSMSRIAKELGRDPKTIKKYLGKGTEMDDGKKKSPAASGMLQNKRDDRRTMQRVFHLLMNGMPPEKIVAQEGYDPDFVFEMLQKLRELQSVESGEEWEQEFLEDYRHKYNSLRAEVGRLRDELREMSRCANNCPFYNVRERFVCNRCGLSGAVTVAIKCSACKHWTQVGNFPGQSETVLMDMDEETERFWGKR